MKTKEYNLPDQSVSRQIKPYMEIVSKINQEASSLAIKSDSELKKISYDLQYNCQSGNIDDRCLIEAYSLVKEVIRRVLKITPFDVQIIGAIALHQNKVIEMQTGEGKTLTAVFPAYLNALPKKGVHVLTFNDYLAKRDANWMRPVYEFLGMSVGYIQEGMQKSEKKAAYQADITYATAKEVGFDYLRSFIAYDPGELIMKPFHFAIVDEADALLIDEARNPLVLAGIMICSGIDFTQVAHFVSLLINNVDFGIDEYSRNIYLKDPGIEKVERTFAIESLHNDKNLNLHAAINLAIHARMLLTRDIDYVIKNNEIKLVDEFTGRIVEDRKWRNGLQTAVEAKEGVTIQSEGNILNSISLQHFINLYPKKAGMTGTAANAAEELWNFYHMEVVVIPPNKPCRRIDYPDEIFLTKDDKINAIIAEAKKVHATGQPLLIGTLTVKESEELSMSFANHNIPCQVLNAKNDEWEAQIIAEAGKKGAVTISTNMAGRGTDILLGGNDGTGRNEIVRLGGLYVLGTNKHETVRIDKQLRGRAGRQGDVGSSRFFISMEDDLMIKYRLSKALPKSLRNLNRENWEIHKSKLVKFINHIQRVIQGQAYDIRKTLFDYSNFMEKQRTIIQNERQNLLLDDISLSDQLLLTDHDSVLANPDLLEKLRESTLFQYDLYWTDHLDYMQQIREGIHLLRLGGQNPLREFQKKANLSFREMCQKIDTGTQETTRQILIHPEISLASLGIKKPSSTWTYMINDNPFGNQLAIMLMSNVGMQVDFLSSLMIGVYGIIEKIKRLKKRDEEEV